MKNIHLLCNAHLDPIWLWGKNDGIAEAISTFRVASRFCDEYPDFVFNHNEALLYEWVQEYEPELFEKIKTSVKKGNWKIMGGWYLQPDCLMPSGEALLYQIETGRKYFKEKFGIVPATAINFDSFGHSRGLVQILKKCGYDSYVYMRPCSPISQRDFIWQGFDGSEITAHALWGGYNSARGKADEKIESFLKDAYEGENLLLWGIGNHGGGPSKIDIEKIGKFIENHKEAKIKHSDAESFFASLNKDNLPKYSGSLVHCMVGCYTTMAKVKREYRNLENSLVTAEKILTCSGVQYDKSQFDEAVKALLFSQFHDILPGTMIRLGEEESLRLLSYGREISERLIFKSLIALCKSEKKPKENEIPVMVFNPHPYKITQDIEAEFQLADQNWNENESTIAHVFSENGEALPTQNEKESSSLNLDWRKKVVFRAELEPMQLNRFNCKLQVVNKNTHKAPPLPEYETHFVFDNGEMQVFISKNTGLIDLLQCQGKTILKENSGQISAYYDNEDPWAMTTDGFYKKEGVFKTTSKKAANEFAGYGFSDTNNVRIIENGDVRTKIQVLFKHKNSFAVVTYTLPKKGKYIDMHIKIYSNDVNSLYKLSFATAMKNPDFTGQTVFGKEKLLKDKKEVTYQKWCSLSENGNSFTLLNKGSYGGSCDKNKLSITLMRTPVYSAHPIGDRPLTDSSRHHDHIDMGEMEFDYRLLWNEENLDSNAEIYNQTPPVISFFPSGEGKKKREKIALSNEKIILSSFKNHKEGRKLLRLFNSSESKEKAVLTFEGKEYNLEFNPFELKAYSAGKDFFGECELLGEKY